MWLLVPLFPSSSGIGGAGSDRAGPAGIRMVAAAMAPATNRRYVRFRYSGGEDRVTVYGHRSGSGTWSPMRHRWRRTAVLPAAATEKDRWQQAERRMNSRAVAH